MLIGAHTSIEGGVSKSVDLASKLNFTAMQIFTKNNNRWFANPLSEKEIINFKEKLNNSKIKFVVAHDCYLINLCAKVKNILEKSRIAFIDELNRCEQLNIPFLNFHPGSQGGQKSNYNDEKDGIKLIAESLNIIHNKTKNYKVKSMIETTAGQGSAIGYRFEQLREIIDLVEDKNRMSVCIDTAHIFAAGYDLIDKINYENTIKEFDEIIGLNFLQCFHINDSKKELGSRVDRHQHIGKGFIGLKGFRNIMNDKRFFNIPKILETPKTKGQLEDLINIKVLLNLINHKKPAK